MKTFLKKISSRASADHGHCRISREAMRHFFVACTVFAMLLAAPAESIGRTDGIPVARSAIRLQLSVKRVRQESVPVLLLRGGGVPVLPTAGALMAAGAAIALKLNEGFRERVMDLAEMLPLPGRTKEEPEILRTKKARAAKKDTQSVSSSLKPGYDLRNG